MIRVLVVDDTIFYRKIISDILAEMHGVEVIGAANNGAIALSRIRSLKPDLLTLDIEMPVMNGLELLQEIKKQQLDVGCVMVSSKTLKGSEATMAALELGAFDFITKPDDASLDINKKLIKISLAHVLQGFKAHKEMGKRFGKPLALGKKAPQAAMPQPATKPFKRNEKSQVIAIGISTGGPNALAHIIPQFPENIGVPILLVQHMPPVFSASLAQSLNKKSKLTVKEAADGEALQNNTVYVAPGGKQMKVASGVGLKKIIRISDDPPENNCKPAVDYLFRSVAREYGSKSTCVIMTGMGIDGKLGTSVAKASGAIAIAQNAESCVVYGMPKAVIEANLADVVAPLDTITAEILKTI